MSFRGKRSDEKSCSIRTVATMHHEQGLSAMFATCHLNKISPRTSFEMTGGVNDQLKKNELVAPVILSARIVACSLARLYLL
jgi:hypothetical protein